MNFSDHMVVRIISTTIGILVIVIAAPATYAGIQEKRSQIPDTSSWVSTIGWITRSEFSPRDENMARLSVAYSYISNGTEFSSTSIERYHYMKKDRGGVMSRDSAQDFVNRYPVGTEMAIYFHPDNPRNAVLYAREPAGPLSLNTAVAGILIAGLGLILFAWVPAKTLVYPDRRTYSNAFRLPTRIYFDPDNLRRTNLENGIAGTWVLLATTLLTIGFVTAGAWNWSAGIGIPALFGWFIAISVVVDKSETKLRSVVGEVNFHSESDEDGKQTRTGKISVCGKTFKIESDDIRSLNQGQAIRVWYWEQSSSSDQLVHSIWAVLTDPTGNSSSES